MWVLLMYLIVIIILIKLYVKFTTGICKCSTQLDNKVIIVTGANSGIGFETAKDFASRGAKVILACRDENKTAEARDIIIKRTGNCNVIYKHLDLTSFVSVRDFAKNILESESKLDILVNNAGTGKLDNSLTRDNLPVEMQVNYFSPFLLTNLLLPLLTKTQDSRIIVVSSIMHWFGKVDLFNIDKPAKNSFEHSRVYSNSKLCNVLFTKQLSHQLSGLRVTANCLHPGAVNTDIFRNKSTIVRYLIGLIFKTSWEGAQTSIHLALSPQLANVSGKYYADCKEARLSKTAQNEVLARKLWDISEDIVKL